MPRCLQRIWLTGLSSGIYVGSVLRARPTAQSYPCSATVTISPPPDELTFRPMEASEKDLGMFHRCFVDNGFPRTLEHLRWQYLGRPGETLLVDFAEYGNDNGRLAAITAAIPVWMRANGRRVFAAQALDTLTDRAARSQGLFLRMASGLFDRAEREGASLVYGFPNGNSAHGYMQRLSCLSLDPLPVMMRPLRSGYVLRKLKAGALSPLLDFSIGSLGSPEPASEFAFRTIERATPEFDTLWQQFSATIPFALERTCEYLDWRLQRPGERYEIVGLYQNNTLSGYAIIGSSITADNERVGKLFDVIFDTANVTHAEWLIAESLHRLHVRGCSVAWAWNHTHSPGHAAYRGAGFVFVPESLRPTEIHAAVRAFDALEGINDRANWYVSMLDSDFD
jgi:hypothetical protein